MTGRQNSVAEFDRSRVAKGRLFGDALEEDPWVVFHGTSALKGNAIESRGLVYDSTIVSAHELQLIAKVFDAMNWAGTDKGGFGVLATFSKSDFAGLESSPIFLTERSHFALMYASRDFAGGEKLRAVRRSLIDLGRYLTDESIRHAHMDEMKFEYEHLRSLNAHPDLIEKVRPKPVDLNWLSSSLSQFDSIHSKAMTAFDNHQGGIVFALRLEESDLIDMTYDAFMGIKARTTVPPGRIVSRVDVPIDFDIGELFIQDDLTAFIRKTPSGVVGHLTTKPKSEAE